MPRVFPVVDRFGGRHEIIGSARLQTLLGRGYREEPRPVPPAPSRAEVTISASVVLAPWDDARVANTALYDIPGLHVQADKDREGCWPTVEKAWKHGLTTGATHHLVLTDDLTLADGFWDALNACVSLFPDSPMSLLSVKNGARFAVEDGQHWCISWGCSGAANVLPTSLIEPFLSWQEESIDQACPHDDVRLTAWATEQRIGVLTPVPCLVQHGMYPSVIADSPLYGRAHSPAAVFQTNVKDIDWTQGAEDPAFIGISVDRPESWLKDGRQLVDLRR